MLGDDSTMQALFDLYFQAFGKEESDEGKRDLMTHICSADEVDLVLADSEVIGFISYDVLLTPQRRQPFFYLGGELINPLKQRRGLGTSALKTAMELADIWYFGFHTQNSAMLRAGEKLGNYSGQLSRHMAYSMGSRNPVFQNGMTVDRNRYPPTGLYGENARVARIQGLGPSDAGVFCFMRNK